PSSACGTRALGGRRGPIPAPCPAGGRGALAVLPRKPRDHLARLDVVLNRHGHCGPSRARGASADGVHHHQHGSFFLAEDGVDFSGRAGFLKTDARQLRAHRSNDHFIVHCCWSSDAILTASGGQTILPVLLPPDKIVWLPLQCALVSSICIELTMAFSTGE